VLRGQSDALSSLGSRRDLSKPALAGERMVLHRATGQRGRLQAQNHAYRPAKFCQNLTHQAARFGAHSYQMLDLHLIYEQNSYMASIPHCGPLTWNSAGDPETPSNSNEHAGSQCRREAEPRICHLVESFYMCNTSTTWYCHLQPNIPHWMTRHTMSHPQRRQKTC